MILYLDATGWRLEEQPAGPEVSDASFYENQPERGDFD